MKNELFRTKEVNGLVNIVQREVTHKHTRGTIKTVIRYSVFIGCDPVFGVTQYGDLSRFWLTSKSEATKYAKQTTPAESEHFPASVIVYHQASSLLKDKIGIHLRDADQFSFQDALETAQKDLFPAIYIHSYSKSKGA